MPLDPPSGLAAFATPATEGESVESFPAGSLIVSKGCENEESG